MSKPAEITEAQRVYANLAKKLEALGAQREVIIKAGESLDKDDRNWEVFYGHPLRRVDEDIALLKSLFGSRS